MQNKVKRIISVITALVLLSSVLSVIHVGAEDKIPTHTIMLYGVGSDLETDSGCLSFNLRQIMSAVYNENINFIVMTGGAEKWFTGGEYLSGADEISTEYNQIWKVDGKQQGEKHGVMTLLQEKGLEGLENALMSETRTLTGFIDYCYGNFPADRYDIILWDHGGGPANGFGHDMRGGSLNLHDLYDAFAACKLIKDGNTFEIMDFDACLMCSAEVIAALGGFTEQFVGSAETEPGSGQEYFSWLTSLRLEPYIDGATLASYIVESTLLYYNYNESDYVEEVTLAAVNTKRFSESILPGLLQIEDILISEAKTKNKNSGKYDFYDELYSLNGAYDYDYGSWSLYDLENLICALSVIQTEFADKSDEQIKNLSNAYTDTASDLLAALSDKDVIFAKTTKDLKKAVDISCTRNTSGELVWPETDTIDVYPGCISIFFGSKSNPETKKYINEMTELLYRLPDGDEKEFIKKNAVCSALYTIISSLGKYTSMLAEWTDGELDYSKVKSFIEMLFSEDINGAYFSSLVDAGVFENTEDAEEYVTEISNQQIKELIYKDNVTVKQIRKDGVPVGQYQVTVSDTSQQAMRNVYSTVSAESKIIDGENFKDTAGLIFGEPITADIRRAFPYGVYVNVISAQGSIKIAEYIEDYNDADATVKQRIYSSDSSVRILDDANSEVLVMYDAEDNAHLCYAYYSDGAKQKANVPILLYSDLYEEMFVVYLIISYKSDGWSIDGLAYTAEDIANRTYMPLDNELFYSFSYAPCTWILNYDNYMETFIPLCDFMPVDCESDDWGTSFGYEMLSDVPDVKAYQNDYYIIDVYGGYTNITDLVEEADEAAENGDYVIMIDNADVEIEDVVYNGRQQKPEATVTADGKTIENGVDYKIIYDDRTAPDLYSALVMGIGNCHGFVFGSYNTIAFRYEHDPLEDEGAAADIVRDDNAIYGYRPSSTGSLKMYADADWTDPDVVEAGRQERIAYHKSLESMYEMLDKMKAEGKSTEEIARAICAERNRIRFAAYDGKPEELEQLKQRNLEKYGHEEGPLPDELYMQYGSWTAVILKAFSSNRGMDACLGLYDEYYGTYRSLDGITDDEIPPTPQTSDASVIFFVILSSVSLISAIILIKKKSRA